MDDLSVIVQMLADDPLGKQRECLGDPLPGSYLKAFQAIADDPNNQLLLACTADEIAGVLQLTFIPSVTHQGSWRAQIEGVRVAAGFRSRGIGRALLEKAIELAGQHGCRLVQLTTDRQREKALQFYQSLGFTASHHGMKFVLD